MPTGGTSAGGAGAACVVSQDAATIDVTTPEPPDAGPRNTRTEDFDGSVVTASRTGFEVNRCPPNADCVPVTSTKVTIDAPGLDVSQWMIEGTYAHVHFVRACPFNCWTSVVVTSLASWGGVANPFPAQSGLYVAAVDGTEQPDGAPYSVTKRRATCHSVFDGAPSCGGSTPGAYSLVFTDPATGSASEITMGETSSFQLNHGFVTLRNLRSYASGACDADYDWAHWISGYPILPSIPGD